MTALRTLLNTLRSAAKTEREKGTYFEELILAFLQHDATYATLYSDVWTYAEWAKLQGIDGRDTGIDLVAKTSGTDEYHAIQCKFYAEDYRIQKSDIDSFFTASGQKPFTHRIIVSTTDHWGANAEAALVNQQPPVSRIDLHHLENSQIDWSRYQPGEALTFNQKKSPRPHQVSAISAVIKGLKNAERGKLIMACGTGKTFTSLKIAEQMAGPGKRVLFLVPSLSLLSQTLTEWTKESEIPLTSFAVCSDSEVGKKKNRKDDDAVQTLAHELEYPATTDAARLAKEASARHSNDRMSVVFSTYHSIAVISDAQLQHGLADFDLIVCDEAHRTTGATFDGEDESAFVRVHDSGYIRAAKRLYMTATPRIYGTEAKAKEAKGDVVLYSMDNKDLYGEELFVINFSEAVQRGLLCDYKVLILTVDQEHVSSRMQDLLKGEDNTLKVDDAAKIIGCWKALSKHTREEQLSDADPMRRAVAFCQVIEADYKGKKHKVSSKQIAGMFSAVVEAYQKGEPEDGGLYCEAEHVDGSMNASEKEAKINWLKEEPAENTCRILSNVRCLSEGVDVPALDAVLFLTPRNSQVDVVQSVGRVMRNAPGKKLGYVVLPVVIPYGVSPNEALNDNETYRVVWEVLQALRSHDDRFDAMINKLDLTASTSGKMEVIAVSGDVQKKAERKEKTPGQGQDLLGKKTKKKGSGDEEKNKQIQITFNPGEIEKALYAKVVDKCGNRHHWEDWAGDIAKIAQTHIGRITTILKNPANENEISAFSSFADELRDDLNEAISNEEVIEMLAQHLITKPVFDALFKDYSFASNNPVSQAMQHVLDVLNEHRLDKEADTLDKFYASVSMRAEGIDSAAGKQKIVVELYDKFFRNAFPRMTDRLGIVYTPVEVVDFIIHSVNDLLQKEFGQTIGSKGVHVIDPFTGTGTFVTRLLQSGLIKPEEMEHKYRHEIHANELVLLAYYIAAINIEATYHGIMGGDYIPFEGICLTDTFQMYEKEDLISDVLADNSDRRNRQKELDIRVIIGNPPYSAGQTSANDNNKNVAYPHLDSRIEKTYAARSKATSVRQLYDSYIRAIRWASDRIGNAGVIGFVSGSGYAEKSLMDGMRKALVEEFSSIHVLNLRGDIRKNMLSKGRAKEGHNIFGSGSMTGIAITLFVKNPNGSERGKVYYHDIGDDLNRKNKLERLTEFTSIDGITATQGWQMIKPDTHGDWLNQRDDSFGDFIVLGDKKGDTAKLFENFSLGVATGRDAWCYNPSRTVVANNMQLMIGFYNAEVTRFNAAHPGLDTKARQGEVDGFINTDPTQISWTRALKQDLGKDRNYTFEADCLVSSMYRPFTKQWLYFNRRFNEMVYQMPRVFPDATAENRVICVSGIGARSGFSALISDKLINLHTLDTGQSFPLYLYDEEVTTSAGSDSQGDMFEISAAFEVKRPRREALTDEGLEHFRTAYLKEAITKEDIFYYVYGILHSEDYRERYADNLSKELPRIPRVKTAKDFWAFSKAGRDLAELHLNYETVATYPATIEGSPSKPEHYYVTKMKHPKVKNAQGKSVNDRTRVIYNEHITVKGIPEEAYDYVVNGKAAIDWVMERQCVKTDKNSGIVNDANDWALETMNNPKYPLELLLRVITVSLGTQKIVNGLPALDID